MALHRFYQRSPSSVNHLVPNFRKVLVREWIVLILNYQIKSRCFIFFFPKFLISLEGLLMTVRSAFERGQCPKRLCQLLRAQIYRDESTKQESKFLIGLEGLLMTVRSAFELGQCPKLMSYSLSLPLFR
ncbi:hypothetical protein LguiB_018464 [Lonicera macranthoides]